MKSLLSYNPMKKLQHERRSQHPPGQQNRVLLSQAEFLDQLAITGKVMFLQIVQ